MAQQQKSKSCKKLRKNRMNGEQILESKRLLLVGRIVGGRFLGKVIDI
ncbi:hypothetical protein JCM19239_4190 [Vibrio variabilis]|uniref:Uncharacterized protein n=1 Tax=Vibrio variabilis TaxID=990271 RepID=A0ABQ0JAA3_9VIBR|nr:hypothetical protein JCM19239_4190 [Vibrio variabilis]